MFYTGGEKPRAAATGQKPLDEGTPPSIIDAMEQVSLERANWQRGPGWICPPGYAFLPGTGPMAPAPVAQLRMMPQPQMMQPPMQSMQPMQLMQAMQPMHPMPTSEGPGLGAQMAAAFSGCYGGRGGRRSEQGEKAQRPKLGPCLFGGGGKRGPPAPPKAARSSAYSSAPSRPVPPADLQAASGSLFQGLLRHQQPPPPVPPAPLSSESLFQMGFDPDDVGRAIVHAHGEPLQALMTLIHAGKARIRSMQVQLDRIADVYPSAEASLPMPPLPPSGPHEDPTARPGDPGVAPGVQYTPPEFRVKKKRLAPRHKREALSFLSEVEQEALPVDAGQEDEEEALTGPTILSDVRMEQKDQEASASRAEVRQTGQEGATSGPATASASRDPPEGAEATQEWSVA